MEVRVRIAPSPTGIPHIGNTRTALYNYLFAKKNKGKFIVRIEDTDRERLVPQSQAKILEILKFLGLVWDEGPAVGGPFGPYIQSERLKIYRKYAEDLVGSGKAYYCFCSKERLEKLRNQQRREGKLPKYDRFCLNLKPEIVKQKIADGEKYVIRLKIPYRQKISWNDLIQGRISFDSETLDDQVLLKSDGFPTYHLSVVVDDYLMKISHVLRGVEWLSSTPKHILLYKSFGWPLPIFGHLPIILGPDRKKLSKRHGAKSALDYRDEGYLPQAINNFMVFLGWSYKDNSDLLALDELIRVFDLSRVRRANPIFDIKKLDWFNQQWLRKLDNLELLVRLRPYLKVKIKKEKLLKIIPLIKTRIVKLTEANSLIDFFAKLPEYKAGTLIAQGASEQDVKCQMSNVKSELETLDNWTLSNIEEILNNLIEKNHWQKNQFFMILRIAVTGKTVTPPLAESMEILGKKEVLARLKIALDKLK